MALSVERLPSLNSPSFSQHKPGMPPVPALVLLPCLAAAELIVVADTLVVSGEMLELSELGKLVGTPPEQLSPLPPGWSKKPTAICIGHPPASSWPNTCAEAPGFAGQCTWPYMRSGFAAGAYAAAQCTAWGGADCAAVTCGPAVAGGAIEWCWARSQFAATCSVPGYISFAPCASPFRLPSIFGSHMVLQRAPKRAVLWGFATPASVVSADVVPVAPGGAMATATAVANASGVWTLKLPAVLPSPPTAAYSINITSSLDRGGGGGGDGGVGAAAPSSSSSSSSSSSLLLEDVLFGEVWVVAGQSNAAFTMGMMAQGAGPLAANASAEIAASAAAHGDALRLFNTGINAVPAPPRAEIASVGMRWSRAAPSALGGSSVMGDAPFSAVGWYFARELSLALGGVPIGVIMATQGGTALESWMSAELLYGGGGGADPAAGVCPADPADPSSAIPSNSFSAPASNFNGQIAPLVNTTVRGVLFYQGESNEVVGANATYTCRFGAMIADWAARWVEGTAGETDAVLPFGYVQIGPDCGPSEHTFATRLGQAANNRAIGPGGGGWPSTFMAAALDVPNTLASGSPAGGVHLMDKRTIAARLVRGALATVGGYAAALEAALDAAVPPAAGPRFERATAVAAATAPDATAGTRVVVHLANVGSADDGLGLELRAADGFELLSDCGWGGSWVPARIVNSSVASVTVEARSMINVGGVRYAAQDTPCRYLQCAIYANGGLPLAPFLSLSIEGREANSAEDV